MATQSVSSPANLNPQTTEEAKALVKYVESLFNPWNVDALVNGFTPDCVVRFCDIPEFSGHKNLRNFFTARSERQKNYKLVKTLRAYVGDTICGVGEGEWDDVATGLKMSGFGCEIWQLRGGKIARWEGAFNASPVGTTSISGPLTAWKPS